MSKSKKNQKKLDKLQFAKDAWENVKPIEGKVYKPNSDYSSVLSFIKKSL